MIVVDTNVIAYLWIPGVHTSSSESLFKKDPEWAVPLLWRSEFRNVLGGYLQHKLMDLETALQIASEAEAFLKEKEYLVSSDQILNLAHHSKCSAYDCEFVALAQDLGTSLATSDKQILKAFPKIAVDLKKFG